MNKENEFDWKKYEDGFTGDNKLIPNLNIKGSSEKEKCFSREPYAQKLFDIYTKQESKLIKKDLEKGECIPIVDISNIKETSIDVEISGGLSFEIDLTKEKRFLQIFGHSDIQKFTSLLKNEETLKSLLKEELFVYVTESFPTPKISLWQGYLKKIRAEFIDQIENPSKAYTCMVKEANKGGFFVEIYGIDGFMPGSLAAPNKIMDFQSYVGKEITVMIEDYIPDMKSFIVSHKKYIDYILPKKLEELDLNKEYTGNVTGTSKYGIFVEFEDFFTGLLHVSKMKEETKRLFWIRHFKPTSEIKFYIGEITKDKRIILTEESQGEKKDKIEKFIFDAKDKTLESEIAAVMHFGIIINVEGVNGLVPLREFKRKNILMNNFIVKDKLNVIFDAYRNDKLVFKLP